MEKLYGGDIWTGFTPLPAKMRGYNDWSPYFKILIEETRPGVIVEIGSWYGASALAMANITKELGLDCWIACIDTWLGSVEHWHYRNRPELMLKHGYPQLFYQFLSNVVDAGRTDVILPIPMTSLCGMRWLKSLGVRADLIYVDGSHNDWDVHADLMHAHQLLRAGGVLCGDDYTWESVSGAVKKYAKQHGKPIETMNDPAIFWVIR